MNKYLIKTVKHAAIRFTRNNRMIAHECISNHEAICRMYIVQTGAILQRYFLFEIYIHITLVLLQLKNSELLLVTIPTLL